MSTITLEINDLEIVAESGLTILEVAKRSDIEIPTLCSVNGKNSETPCDLCIVEIEGVDQPVRACVSLAKEGMKVQTDSADLKKRRQDRLAQISSTHFGDCKAPCNLTCPGQINVQGYIAHISKGEYEEALRLVMDRNPLPFSVGRVCPRFCETRCRRILVDEPVSINHLKRFVADWCMTNRIDLNIPREKPTGKRVAVIGGGPTGLTTAFYLARKGHDVMVFESKPKLGGMLRYGLPEYKIPRDVLDYEMNMILRMGISVKVSQKWGVDFTLQDLKDQGYDAIMVATGAGVDKPLEIPGGRLPHVLSAANFMRDVAEGKTRDYGRRAAVIGGNNIAMEVARTLLRQNVDEVTVIYPRSQEEMPANQRIIREAEKEGVQFLLMYSPVQICESENSETCQPGDGGLTVELVRMKLGEPDARGNRQPEAIPGTSNIVHVDTLVSSLGQMACQDGFTGGELEEQLEVTNKNTIKASPRDFTTSISGVFAAGDAVNGTRTVIQSVVAARRAADNIHAHIMDVPKAPADNRFNFTRGKSFDQVDLSNFDGINIKLREKMPERPPEICTQDYGEVKLGFNEQMAKKEADRCLSCGCSAFDTCDLKQLDIDYNVNINKTGMGTKPIYPKDNSHPTIDVDLNKCIYCQQCVNSCEYDALEISTSGEDDQGNPAKLQLNFKDNCVHCGQCAENCSTGALIKKASLVPIVHEEVKEVRSTCPYCGAGCQLVFRVKGNTIMEIVSDPDVAPNYGALCVKGRFAHDFVSDKSRLTKPLVRRNGQLVETSWDDALEIVARNFFDIKAMYGPDSIAGFSCARATNEENFLMQKFMRTVIGTNNIEHCARL